MAESSSFWKRLLVPLGALLLVSLSAEPGARAEPLPEVAAVSCVHDFVYYYPDTVGKDPGKLVSLYQSYLDAQVSPKLGYPITVRYFKQLEDLIAFVAACRRRGQWPFQANLHAEVALQFRQRWQLEVFATAVSKQPARSWHTICAAVRKGSGITSLEALRGKSVIAPAYWGMNVRRFEDRLLAGRLRLSDIGTLNLTPSSLSAVTGVIFRQADAAFVSSLVFDELQKRSSRIWGELSIIYESPRIPVAVAAFFPGVSEHDRKVQIEETFRLQTTPEGVRWFDYEQGSHLEPVTWTDLYTDTELGEAAAFEAAHP